MRPLPVLGPQRFPIIFAAPSGAGKTSIALALRDRRSDMVFSISVTTRPPRPHERDGVDYFFRSHADFQAMIEAGDLLEWAEVHGNFYGTPRRNLIDAATEDRHLVLDIDVQGSRAVRAAVPEAVSIFVLPPSGEELVRRLTGRGTESPEVLRRRLMTARNEIRAVEEFDYVIVNDDVDRAVDAVETILAAESRRGRRLAGLPAFVERLSQEVGRRLESPPEDGTISKEKQQ